jgi:acetate kinase
VRILVVNVGSTSLKLRVIGDNDEIEGRADLPPLADLDPGALDAALAELGPVDAVGHRIVHGGPDFTAPVLVDDRVVAELRALTDLAPLHQPPALDALDAVSKALPDTPAVACFDTAFHATLPAEASTYAIPQRWRDLGARRYGFHGLSHSWASRRAVEICAGPAVATLPTLHPLSVAKARVVTCHLGGGASLAAVAAGRCIDTTMGFTPLEGLVMTTRSGSVDPGLVLWLQEHCGLSTDEVADTLEHGSGLVGLCGDSDMRAITRRVADCDSAAVLAFGVYLHRLRAEIAAMTAALGGIDALAFTGGIGEGSPPTRASACAGLGFLGVTLDHDANALTGPDRVISAAGSAVRVVVVEAREDLQIAAGVRSVLGR